MTNDTEVSVTDAATDSVSPKRKRGGKVFVFCILLILIFSAGSGIMFLCALNPLSIESGENPPAAEDFSALSFLPLTCTTDLSDVSLTSVGTHRITYTLFGIPLSTTLTVADTTPPVFTMRDHAILRGSEISAENFFLDASDHSAFSCTLILPDDWQESGTHTVSVQFTDAYQNTAVGSATLTVYDVENAVFLEAGSSETDCLNALRAHVPEAELQGGVADISWNTPGVYPVSLRIQDQIFEIQIHLTDTTPPQVTLQKAYTILDSAISPEAFLKSVEDVTETSAVFQQDPDLHTPGVSQVTILVSDTSGNTATCTGTLYVYDIPSAVQVEAGISPDALLQSILGNRYGRSGYAFADGEEIAVLPTGIHTVSIRTPHGDFPIEVTVEDTTPPAAVGKSVTVYLSDSITPTAESFVADIRDESNVTVSFVEEPDFTTPGTRTVQILLTDEAGNTAVVSTTVTVSAETPPPQITGVRDIAVFPGDRISYLSGVNATDAYGNPLQITVDSSAVQANVPGTYRIIYHTADRFGKTASVTASVTVQAMTEDVIRPYAEKILRGILSDGMTKREQARAIYDWMTTGVYYRAYADKSDWIRAAYTGFTTGCGDCFVYYAMSRCLLTCAGIENLEIQRDNPEKPHFWNLINCGDGWFHFDTCPHYKQFPLTSFMLTDAEVKAYSENCVEDYYSFDASLYPATP